MKNTFTVKFATIFAISLLLLIPIGLIGNLIDERESRHQEVKQDIAKSSSKAQQIIGPFIYASYWHTENKGDEKNMILKKLFVLPNELNIDGTMHTDEKKRGIYSALIYRANTTISGSFNTSSLSPILDKSLHSLNLVMAISDMRGIGVDTEVAINNQLSIIAPGTQIDEISEGIHIALDIAQLTENKKIEFSISTKLMGMESLKVVPIGKKSTVSLQADWPHPSFNGEHLPITSKVDDNGFAAQWQTSYFATNIESLISQCIYRAKCDALKSHNLGVNLIDPVDHYLKSHRAINYAILLITLAFVCFFLLEVIRKHSIHPIQYGFVGLALALFYLLLLSLSEHLGFNIAYVISAIASTMLLTNYVNGILKNNRHTALFAFALGCLYGLMFILLGAEDFALLLGSLLIFAVLSVMMLMTKSFNWYETIDLSQEKV